MKEIETYVMQEVMRSLSSFVIDRYLNGYGATPNGFTPPTEEEKRKMELDYANDKTRLGASRGGW